MRASCLTFGRRHTLRVWRPRELKPGPGPRGPLKSLGCRSQSDRPQPKVARGRLRRRRSSPMRLGIALVAPPCIRPRGARNAASHPFSPARSQREGRSPSARAPFLVLLGLLLGTVFFWARTRYGSGAALLAVALLAFDPNVIAHAGIVHTDLGAALTVLAAVLAWENLRRAPSLQSLLGAAVALGIALVTKFSAVYLVPIFLLQGLLAARREARPGAAVSRMLGRLVLVGAGALVVVLGVYSLVTARMDLADQREVIHEMVALRGAPGLSRVIESIAGVCPPLGHYLGGLASVARQNAIGGGVNYFFGKVSVTGFPLYFFVAFLFKSALAFLAVCGIALFALARDPEAREEAPLLLLPVGVLFLASIGSSYNIGIRHMLPAYPFLALAAAGAFARAPRREREKHVGRSRVHVWLLAALPIVSAAGVGRIPPHAL